MTQQSFARFREPSISCAPHLIPRAQSLTRSFSLDNSVVTTKSLAAPLKSAIDKIQLRAAAFLRVRGLVKQPIDSFQFFVNHEIKKIMESIDLLVCRHERSFYHSQTHDVTLETLIL
ncbi:RING [Musa troglodytarum]|uniref:RING n=1 Tax=Musa troglodytarum TaxID=320322 RepID=A0A9E7KDZ2_9LILI|nr:RING [Musa troglodytarum]